MRRRLLQAGGVVLFLVAAVAVTLLVEHLRGAWQLRSTLRELQARGERLNIQQLLPPARSAASNSMDRLMSSATGLDGSSHLNPPAMRLAAPGRGISATRLDSWEGMGGTNIGWDMVEAWVNGHAAELAELQEALAQPVCRPVVDLSPGFTVALPHLTKVKSATISLSLLTAHAAHAGNFDAALGGLRSMFRIESVLANEPITISQLVRVATAAIAFNRAWDVLHAQDWSEEQLRQLQAAVPMTRFAEAMVYGLEGERAMFLPSVDQLSADDLDGMLEGSLFEPVGGPPVSGVVRGRLWDAAARFGNLRARVFRFGWGDQAQATYLDAVDRVLVAARAAVGAASRDAFSRLNLDAFLQPAGLRESLRTAYARIALFALARSVDKGLVADVHRDLLLTDIALQRHHRRHGRYPGALEDLVPDFLPAVPVDAMDGRPLRYLPEPGGAFVLWSVGEDQRDDGGDPAPADREPTYWWRAKDGVWPRPASGEETRAWVEAEARKREERRRERAGQAPGTLSSELLRRYGLQPSAPQTPAR